MVRFAVGVAQLVRLVKDDEIPCDRTEAVGVPRGKGIGRDQDGGFFVGVREALLLKRRALHVRGKN